MDFYARQLRRREIKQECAFWGSERCSPKLWVKLPKNWNFGGVNRTFKPKRQKIQTLITWKVLSRSWRIFLQGVRTTGVLSSVGPWLPNKSKMAADAIFNFGKMSIPPDWIKISAPYFMGKCITAMRIWSRDQKSKPEVNSRDVIKWTSEAYVPRSQWPVQIFEPNFVQSTNTTLSTSPNGQIHII